MGHHRLHVLFAAVCSINTLTRMHLAAQVTGAACSCSTGCDFTQSCTPVGSCVKDNVALGRPAHMSSSWGEGHACFAVNGNNGTVYLPIPSEGQNPNCIHTSLDDLNAWWLVKLDRNYTVTDITVYINTDQPNMMAGVVITVDDQECYTFSSKIHSLPSKTDVSCSAPRKGNVVKFYKNGIAVPKGYFLTFCEVQVWVCKPGLYGINCDNKCNCIDDEICDNYYGTCTRVLSQQNCDRDMTGTIVGSVVGVGLIISVSIIAVIIWLRRTSMKEKQSPEPKSKVTYDASCEMHSRQDLNFQEDVYGKFESQEEVAKPYTVRRKENHDANHMYPTALENNYEKLAPQYQNPSADSKPYEVLDVSSK